MILPVLLQSSKIRLLDKYELIAIVCCSNVCYMQKAHIIYKQQID